MFPVWGRRWKIIFPDLWSMVLIPAMVCIPPHWREPSTSNGTYTGHGAHTVGPLGSDPARRAEGAPGHAFCDPEHSIYIKYRRPMVLIPAMVLVPLALWARIRHGVPKARRAMLYVIRNILFI